MGKPKKKDKIEKNQIPPKDIPLKDIPNVTVSGEVMDDVIGYLQTRPYSEVADLIRNLKNS